MALPGLPALPAIVRSALRACWSGLFSFEQAEIDLCEEILAQNVNRIAEYDVYDPPPADRPTTANTTMRRMPLVAELSPKAGLRAAAIPLKEHKGALVLISDFATTASRA